MSVVKLCQSVKECDSQSPTGITGHLAIVLALSFNSLFSISLLDMNLTVFHTYYYVCAEIFLVP